MPKVMCLENTSMLHEDNLQTRSCDRRVNQRRGRTKLKALGLGATDFLASGPQLKLALRLRNYACGISSSGIP
jgi:hypothetical protein